MQDDKKKKNSKKKSVKQNNKKVDNKKVIKKEKKEGVKETLFTKKYSLFDVLFFVFIVGVASILLTSQYVVQRVKESKGVLCNSTLSKDKELGEFSSIYKEVVDNYYEKVDKKKMIEAAVDGMLNFLEDNYSIHMDSDQSNNFDDNLEGTYEGIGIVLQANEIIEIYSNTPASKAGLEVGDIVKKIGGKEVTEENAYEVIQNVREKLGNKLEIVVERDGKELSKSIPVKTVNLPIVTSNFVEFNKKRIGYMKISSFTSNSFEQFSEQLVALEEKDSIEKLIIDVRDNGGGYLEQAADIASLFVEKGKVIYSLQDRKSKKDIKDTTKDKRNYEIVVLINGSSASASEILAGALKDNNNAILVGEKSFGKGKVQTTKKLEDNTILKYTSSKWLRPNGECVEGVGITPDHVIEQKANKDTQYEKAISLLK